MFERQEIEDLLGRTVHGYRVTRFVSRDGMTAVFEGIEESSAQLVVITFFDPQVNADETFPARFTREAQAVAQLRHPNIVRVLDYGAEGLLHFLITERIDGERLADRVIASSPLSSVMTATILKQVGAALAYAHRLGLVHGQITPSKIVLAKDGRVLLADFGVAAILGEQQSQDPAHGTAEYLAPEQAAGGKIVGPRTDVYALAIVAYALLVGRVPFQAPNRLAVLGMQQSSPPPRPSSLSSGFPASVEAVLLRALAKDPDERPESVASLVNSLLFAMDPTEPATAPLSMGHTTPIPSSQPSLPAETHASLTSRLAAVLARVTRVARGPRLAIVGIVSVVVVIGVLMFSPVLQADAPLKPLIHAGATLRPLKSLASSVLSGSPAPSATPPNAGGAPSNEEPPPSSALPKKGIGGANQGKPSGGNAPADGNSGSIQPDLTSQTPSKPQSPSPTVTPLITPTESPVSPSPCSDNEIQQDGRCVTPDRPSPTSTPCSPPWVLLDGRCFPPDPGPGGPGPSGTQPGPGGPGPGVKPPGPSGFPEGTPK